MNASPTLAMCPRACGAFFLLASANSFRIPVRADIPVFSARRSESRSPLMLDFRNLFEGAIAGLRKDPSELRALDSAPRANVTSFLAEDVTTEPSAALQAFEAEGFVRVNRVLSHETATLLREYVDHTLEEKVEFESDEILDPGRYVHSFPAPSLWPSHSRLASAACGRYDLQLTLTRYDLQLTLTRYDLQLDLAPPVRRALAELLETVEPLVARALGADAEYATASSQRAAITATPRAIPPLAGTSEHQIVEAHVQPHPPNNTPPLSRPRQTV